MSLLQMSFCGAVIVLAVLAIRALAASRLPKRTFIALWMVVLLRLLLPFEIPSEFSVYTLTGYEFGDGFEKDAGEENFRVTKAGDKAGSFSSLETSISVYASEGKEIYTVSDAGQEQQPEASAEENMEQDTALSQVRDGDGEYMPAWMSVFLTDRVKKTMGILIWGAGALICVLFFSVAYVRCRREFAMSLPVRHAFVHQWMQERHLSQKHGFMRWFVRRMEVRMSDRVDTPLAYGIFRPVILLPKKIDWQNEAQLEYILWHEYTHIYYFDTIIKLVAAAACCVHWFNPLVWLMYVLLGHDIELACDESVVRKRGIGEKSAYANMLIGMEAKRSGMRPLCSGFSRNVIEKRIRSIMKIHRFSAGAVVIAVGLVMSVTLVFATSATHITAGSMEVLPFDSGFTSKEYEKLRMLCLEGYEDMSVLDYRSKVLSMTGTEEYWELLERFYLDKTLYAHRDDDAASEFLFYVLKPLTSIGWKSSVFIGNLSGERLETGKTPGIAYSITMRISNENDLTVGEYAAVCRGIREGLQAVLDNGSEEQRADAEYMKRETEHVKEELEKMYGSYKLWVEVDAQYSSKGFEEPSSGTSISGKMTASRPAAAMGEEPSSGAALTQEDCHALLALMESGYKQKRLVDFNNEVLEWSEKNPDIWQRFLKAGENGSILEELPEEERNFILHTLTLSAAENDRRGECNRYVAVDRDFWYNAYSSSLGIGTELEMNFVKRAKSSKLMWNYSYAFFSYYASGGELVTVGERDRCVGGMLDALRSYWEDLDMNDIVHMDRGNLGVKANELAKEYSSADITISPIVTWTGPGWRPACNVL